MKTLISAFTLLLIGTAIHAQTDPRLIMAINQLDSIDRLFVPDDLETTSTHPTRYHYLTENQLQDKASLQSGTLALLLKIPNGELNRQDQINKEILILRTQDQISEVTFKRYLVPFNSEGGFFNSPVYFISDLPFDDVDDYRAYLNWLPSFASYIDFNISLMYKGMREGLIAPKVITKNIINLLAPWIVDEPENHPFYRPLHHFPESITQEQRFEIQKNAHSVITDHILPAYKRLDSFLTTKYLDKSPVNVGISEIKNGAKYYEDRIRHFTTQNITPDEVYDIGLAEVSRIRSQMESIIKQLNFDGDFQDFIGFLRKDPRFYANNPQELLNHAAWLSKKAEAQLPRLFSNLYALPFTVEPVPADIAPNYTGGRYVPGSRNQDRAGIYWVNTYNLPSRPLYTLPSLTLHEAVPGHHLQITLASELKDFPSFRTSYYISAFGEGWGLYAEYLGEEMNMYETPYELFGRYTYEMWRACRLVVDVGMHYKGWSRDRAVDFMAENTALSLHEVNTEIDRYIGWPGQAVSYKIGELTIKKLRQLCEKSLGDQFDIQEFHKVILRNGSIPLTQMEKEVELYLLSKQSK